MTANHTMLDILQKKNLFPKSPLVFHEGVFESDAVDKLIVGIDNQINTQRFEEKLKKKTFNISVEVLQNLYHALKENDFPSEYEGGLFAIFREEGFVNVMSGNFLKTSQLSEVRSKVTMVNELSSEELKTLYRGVLDTGSVSKSGGAGLGFIDMARKSGNTIDYDFIRINTTYSFFVLKIKING